MIAPIKTIDADYRVISERPRFWRIKAIIVLGLFLVGGLLFGAAFGAIIGPVLTAVGSTWAAILLVCIAAIGFVINLNESEH